VENTSGIENVGECLTVLRKVSGLTLDALAEKVGTSKAALSKIENNQRPLSLQLLERLAKPLGFKPEALVLYCIRQKYTALDRPEVLRDVDRIEQALKQAPKQKR
jgi:transcriptional regulator with XRE-family HTH domain